MNWGAIRQGLDDELLKIAEFSLAGLSQENLAAYPRPEPMPGDGFSKAQSILQKAQQYAGIGSEKTAAFSGSFTPDELPMVERLRMRKRRNQDPPPTKTDKALAYGGHVMAGTGAAKFLGDVAETNLGAYHAKLLEKGKTGLKYMNEKNFEGRLPQRYKAGILAAGATLGLAHKLRKEHRRKKWQQGKTVTAASLQFPRSGMASKNFLSKPGIGIRGQAATLPTRLGR